VSLSLLHNALTRASVQGLLLLPFFNQPLRVNVGLTTGGDCTIEIPSSQPASLGASPSPNALFSLEIPHLLRLGVQSLALERKAGVFSVRFSGRLTPLVGVDEGLVWPDFQVKELAIDSNGNVHLDGGWLDLPDHLHLDFYGFA